MFLFDSDQPPRGKEISGNGRFLAIGSYFSATARDLGPNLSNRYCHNRLLMAVRKVPVTQVRTEVGLSLAQMSAGPSPAATVAGGTCTCTTHLDVYMRKRMGNPRCGYVTPRYVSKLSISSVDLGSGRHAWAVTGAMQPHAGKYTSKYTDCAPTSKIAWRSRRWI